MHASLLPSSSHSSLPSRARDSPCARGGQRHTSAMAPRLALPPLLFSADELTPDADDACGDVPVHIYRRMRVLRALGAAPAGRILPPPVSRPRALPSGLDRRRGQFLGDFAVTTWNAQALFASDIYRSTAKI
eukprot:2596498-Pyramimonas_sp.AAC.1